MVLWTHLYGAKARSDLCVLVESPERDDEWQVARTVTTVVKGRLPIRVRNLNPYPILIPQRRPLANVFQVDPRQIRGEKDLVLKTLDPGEVEVDVQTNHISTKAQHPVNLLKGDGSTTDQQQKMDSLLQRWRDIFAAGDEDFGQTSAVLHSIPTGSAPPSRERYRPVPPSLYPELRELLQNMVDNDVIRESSSPWAAPIVLVKKKDGSWRFCVDYRKLNALTHKDAYPLPRIEESLTSLKQAAWYSTLDLASGYWKVDVDPKDREKTALTTPLGLYEFQRMPFGLCNAPATFQRLMQRCLGGQVHDSLLISFDDDVVVYSPDFDTHISHLEQVFEKLAAHGLKLQPHKCSLFQRKVTYLGHVISGEGISTDPEKTVVVENWPIPFTIKQVRSFLGFVGYYRRFVKGFSKIAAPLNALLVGSASMRRGNASINWTTDCQMAFDSLKTALVSAPILTYADFSKSFHLYTDASLGGLGAVLAELQDGRERVIAYASRSLNPTERNDQNYSSFKLEFLALKWAVTEKFKDYLWGNKFLAFTDNNPLVHLNTAHLGATEQRWAAQLANFDFELKYRPSASNRNADVLSRLPQETGSNRQAQVETAVVESEASTEAEDHWRDWQEKDQTVAQMKGWVVGNCFPGAEERKACLPATKRLLREWSRLHIQEGVLKRRAQERHTGLSLYQIVVPKEKTYKLWEKYHNASGHMGIAKVEGLLRKTFFWPGMGADLQDWASKCLICTQQKRGPEFLVPSSSPSTPHHWDTLAHGFSYHCYADDTQLFLSFQPDDPTVAARVSSCLADISTWMKEHHLQLNLAKTELLVLPANPSLQHDFTIQLESSLITPSRLVRNLGVTFDDQLTFTDHISKTARSCRFALHNIRKIRPFLTEHATQLIVQALVISRLDYCNALLAGLPACATKPLQMIQNAAARLVFNEPKRAHVTPLFISLHWLPLAARIKFKALTLAYRTITSSAPSYFHSLLRVYIPTRHLRSD
ncbi:hypothetical protein PO909_025751 [Leuciscus waleckii]